MQFLKTFYPNFQQTNDHSYPQPNYNSSVVLPIRNTIFLTVAMARAQEIEARRIIIGATIDDIDSFLGMAKFPDLNPKYHLALENLIERGCLSWVGPPVGIWSPARQGISKTKNLKNGFEVFGNLVYKTYSCYMNSEQHCGKCFGCAERRKVFKKAGIEDKTEYEI